MKAGQGLRVTGHLAGHGYREETVVIHPRRTFGYQRFSDTKSVIAAWIDRLMTAKVSGRPYWIEEVR
jgi:hypothetical protein